LSMGIYYEGGAVIAHKARLLIACGGEGKARAPTFALHTIKCMQVSLFSYSPISVLLRQPLSIKKGYAGAVHNPLGFYR
jgi:hypothetical protein